MQSNRVAIDKLCFNKSILQNALKQCVFDKTVRRNESVNTNYFRYRAHNKNTLKTKYIKINEKIEKIVNLGNLTSNI